MDTTRRTISAPPERPKPDIAYMSEFWRTSRFSERYERSICGGDGPPQAVAACARIEPAALSRWLFGLTSQAQQPEMASGGKRDRALPRAVVMAS